MIDIKAFNIFVELLKKNSDLCEKLFTTLDEVIKNKLYENILSSQNACKYLKISKTTLLEEEKAGRLKPSRIGKKQLKRYFVKELNDYLLSRKSGDID